MIPHRSAMAGTSPTTTSRRSIIDRLESRLVDGPELPVVDPQRLTEFDDPLKQFCDMSRTVGGEVHLIDRPEQAAAILNQIPAFATATRIASLVPDVAPGNVDLTMTDDPHALATLDWTIVRGDFAVAENGAIWIDGNTLPHRVMLFIAQYLAIVVSRKQIVHHMHQAYARVGKPPHPFGIFVSGPSKTADIEQSLVLGAHGCRALQVFLTE